MYPTVNSLMGLWNFVTAREVSVIEHCQTEVTKFLSEISADDLFKQETWKHLTAFVQIMPDGDILPSRSKYSAESNVWQVAVNHVYSGDDQRNALWFSLPDIVASVILTGRIPKIIGAFRLKAVGASPELHPVSLRGAIEVDPRQMDFFRVVIQERKRLDSRNDISQSEKDRLNKSAKGTCEFHQLRHLCRNEQAGVR